jgi:hypothetical protein
VSSGRPLEQKTLSPLRLLAAAALVACSSHVATPPPASTDPEPSWEDAFELPPPVLLGFRPRSLRHDPLFGPLLDRALALARARSRVVDATRALDVLQDADEVIVGLRGDPGEASDEAGGDMVAAVLGIRADVDPASLVDSSGHPLWSSGSAVRVPELVRERDENGELVGASLFELPGRAWVMASGPARLRLRDAWSRPHPHPRPLELPDADRAVVFARVDGRFLVSRLRWLRPPAALAPVGHGLRRVELTLTPGATDVNARFAYGDDDSAAAAERTLDDAVAALGREGHEGTERLAWLGSARVSRAAADVISVVVPFPPRLVDVLSGRSTSRPSGGVDGGVAPAASIDAGVPSHPPR